MKHRLVVWRTDNWTFSDRCLSLFNNQIICLCQYDTQTITPTSSFPLIRFVCGINHILKCSGKCIIDIAFWGSQSFELRPYQQPRRGNWRSIFDGNILDVLCDSKFFFSNKFNVRVMFCIWKYIFPRITHNTELSFSSLGTLRYDLWKKKQLTVFVTCLFSLK